MDKMVLAAHINALLAELAPYRATLVAVTKTKPLETLQAAYELGLRVFGENKVQEMAAKQAALPPDLAWHLIGHLQSNKVKYMAPFVSLVHSVDSLKLLQEIDRQGAKAGRVIHCLLQIHIAEEESKFGLSQAELFQLLEAPELPGLAHVRLRGLMGMASNTDNQAQVQAEFKGLRQLFEQVRAYRTEFTELSMGMSNDYRLALDQGSTLVRVGSKLFGERA